MKNQFPNKSWRDGRDPHEVARLDEQVRRYWEDIYGKRELNTLEPGKGEKPYVAPPPDCATCSDLGVFKYDVEPGDPLFGKFFNCPHCAKGQANERDRWERKYKTAELPKLLRGFTFESWDSTIHEENKYGKWPAYLAARQYVDNADHMVDMTVIYEQLELSWEEWRDRRPKNSLVFYGNYGTGKSGLMAAIINELLGRGETCLYVSTHGIIEDYQDTYHKDAEQTTKEVLMKYKSVPVLVIDDFNVHKTSDDKLDKIEQIIRYRYHNELPTLMTMNIDQQQFKAMWSDRSGVAAVAMAHWVEMSGTVLRRADPPVFENREDASVYDWQERRDLR